MRNIRQLLVSAATIAAGVTMLASWAPPAQAAEVAIEAAQPTQMATELPAVAQESPPKNAISFAEYTTLFDELFASDVQRITAFANGQRRITFMIGDGQQITLADPRSLSRTSTTGPDPIQALGGGWDIRGIYISFNQFDQGALIGGGGAALATAICFIPAVGQIACVAAVTIVAVATTYLIQYGKCPGTRPSLRVYVNDPARSRCVA